MNLVGKIFVGVIALLSVVCLTLSVASFMSHHNYKDKSDELAKQIKEVQDEKSSLETQKKKLTENIAAEGDIYKGEIQALQAKADELEKQNDDLKKQNDDLSEELQKRIEAISANNAQIDELRQQLDSTSFELADAQNKRANYLLDLARTMESLHELSAINGDLTEQNESLNASYEEAKDVLAKNGLSEDPNAYADMPQFAVQGSIETIKADDDGLLMISIGSDDGLAEHNKLDVRRGNSYIGKIEVVALEPNRAVCKVLPEFREGVMMEGDDVYSQKVN